MLIPKRWYDYDYRRGPIEAWIERPLRFIIYMLRITRNTWRGIRNGAGMRFMLFEKFPKFFKSACHLSWAIPRPGYKCEAFPHLFPEKVFDGRLPDTDRRAGILDRWSRLHTDRRHQVHRPRRTERWMRRFRPNRHEGR